MRRAFAPVRTFLYVDDSFGYIWLFSGVAASRDSNGDTMHLPRGCLTICTLAHDVTPLREAKVHHFVLVLCYSRGIASLDLCFEQLKNSRE